MGIYIRVAGDAACGRESIFPIGVAAIAAHPSVASFQWKTGLVMVEIGQGIAGGVEIAPPMLGVAGGAVCAARFAVQGCLFAGWIKDGSVAACAQLLLGGCQRLVAQAAIGFESGVGGKTL